MSVPNYPKLLLAPLPQVLSQDPKREIKLFNILSRSEPLALPPATIDFELQEIPCEEGATTLVQDPVCTLYCYDYAQRRALFTKTDPEKDIYTAPFLYLAQNQNATQIYSIPLELLEKIFFTQGSSDSFSFNQSNTSLKTGDEVAFIFSTGRCGSTLLCKVLGRINGVLGMQEPDPFTVIAGLRNIGGATDQEVITLLRICLLAHCKPKIHKHDVKKYVIKFQSQVTEIMDLFPMAFPKAQNLFMYRNADGVTKSISKMTSDLNEELQPVETWCALYTGLSWLPGEKKYSRDLAAIYWLTTMTKADKFKKAGMKVPCVRYEELVAETEKVVRELAKIFNVEVTDDNMPHVLDAMKGHSQEGSSFSVHEHEGIDKVVATMRKLVDSQSDIKGTNPILEDTLLK